MRSLKLTLKKIDPVKYALITAISMALIAFIFLGIFTLFSSIFGALLGSVTDDFAPLGVMGGGLAMMILAPVFYFIFGFIFGYIGILIFNFILKKTGGLNLEFNNDGFDIQQIGSDKIDKLGS